MIRAVVFVLACTAAPLAFAQSSEADLFATGEAIFNENCAICHQEDGSGHPPTFPALAGDAALADLALIARNISQGQNDMPPFPDLTAEDVAAVATYIRSAWSNNHGAVSIEDATTALAGLDTGAPTRTIWDGVYTEAQAARGLKAYPGPCGLCHGKRLNGAPDDPDMNSTPPLARAKFIREWDGRSLATLYAYTRASMPYGNPGSLSDQAYIDVLAYMLSVSSAPAGDEELTLDTQDLARITIVGKP